MSVQWRHDNYQYSTQHLLISLSTKSPLLHCSAWCAMGCPTESSAKSEHLHKICIITWRFDFQLPLP